MRSAKLQGEWTYDTTLSSQEFCEFILDHRAKLSVMLANQD
jgi:hypothetical protein